MSHRLEEKIALLRNYFSQKPEVLMVFIFGSYAQKRETTESDLDLAVYFKPEGGTLEWEETRYYEEEDRIWSDVERIAGQRTDFIVLNRAPATLAFSILQEGIPVIIKNPAYHLRFSLMINSAAEYLREFTRDFWMIKQRSMSLSDVDRDRLIRIIDFLEAELADYPEFKDMDRTIYESDAATRRNVERWAENIVNASIDIAKIILASEKKRIPQTYRQITEGLSLVEHFSPLTAQKLAQFSKLRNILAHEYLDIRFDQIKKFVQESETSYKDLVNFVKNFIR